MEQKRKERQKTKGHQTRSVIYFHKSALHISKSLNISFPTATNRSFNELPRPLPPFHILSLIEIVDRVLSTGHKNGHPQFPIRCFCARSRYTDKPVERCERIESVSIIPGQKEKKKKKSPTPTNNQQSDNLSALRIYYYILPLKKRFLAEDTQRIAITQAKEGHEASEQEDLKIHFAAPHFPFLFLFSLSSSVQTEPAFGAHLRSQRIHAATHADWTSCRVKSRPLHLRPNSTTMVVSSLTSA